MTSPVIIGKDRAVHRAAMLFLRNHLQTEAGTPVVANGCRATSRSGRVAVDSSNPYTPLVAIPIVVAPAGSVHTKKDGDDASRGAAAVKGRAFGVRSSAVRAGSCKRARARKRVSRGSEGPHCEGRKRRCGDCSHDQMKK
ncbi:hypothetical protein MRX96_018442 [Rhipicephalus microplus]